MELSYANETIWKIVSQINHKIYLPAIQRKFVWNQEQITRLFDSLMKGYPIGTFLFWNVEKQVVNAQQYSMYNFICDYHERDKAINSRAASPFPVHGNDDHDAIWAVLDGQQRLTALYIGLQGSAAYRLPRRFWSNNNAFPPKELYFNLLSKGDSDNEESAEEDGVSKTGNSQEDETIKYEFAFHERPVQDVENPNRDVWFEQRDEEGNLVKLWYLVKDILRYNTFAGVTSRLMLPNNWITNPVIVKNLAQLHTVLTSERTINYCEVSSDSMDAVLDVFVRVNSGGTVLSKSDMLFSTLVSQWPGARGEFDMLLKSLKSRGNGFKFDVDFIMRSCLYLIDVPLRLKVEAFRNRNVTVIQNEWPKIKQAILDTVDLLEDLGYDAQMLQSYAAVHPIVYYRYRGGSWQGNADKKAIQKYLAAAQLKRLFRSSQDSVLEKIRGVLKASSNTEFPLAQLKAISFAGGVCLAYTSAEIDELFDREIGSDTFMVLALLYPHLQLGQIRFHQDHMHPYAGFKRTALENLILPGGRRLTPDQIEDWMRRRDTLANLELLKGTTNQQKSKTPLADWLSDPMHKQNTQYLPDVSYDLSNFEEFMAERQKLMTAALKPILM